MKLLKNLKELGWKEFSKKWKKGITRLTPLQLLKTEIRGYIGSIVGTFLAMFLFIFIYDRLWAIAIIMFFNIIIQSTQLISKYQQLQALRTFDMQEISDIFEEEEDEKEKNKRTVVKGNKD